MCRSPRKISISAARRQFAGFTLIEALVALAIVALGMMAIVGTLNRYAVNSAYLQEKTLATWIATNKITELSVAPTWPEIGDYEEDVEFANQDWLCEIVISATDVDNLRRVDVTVKLSREPEAPGHKVSGLIEPPAPPGFAPPQWSMPGGGGDGGGERG